MPDIFASTPPLDQRASPRYAPDHPVGFGVLVGRWLVPGCMLKDLSCHGVLFSAPCGLKKGTTVRVVLSNRDVLFQCFLPAQVVRCELPNGGVFPVGARFLRPLFAGEVFLLLW